MTDNKGKKLFTADSSKVDMLRKLNLEIKSLLNDPEAKCPVLASEDRGLFPFLPRKWDDFSIISGDNTFSHETKTSIGVAKKFDIQYRTFYSFKNATISEKASGVIQRPLQEWEEAKATIDFSSGNVHVVSATKQAYLKDVILSGTAYLYYVEEINKELAEGDSGMYVTELYADRFGSIEEGVYPPGRSIPVVKNDQISVSCAGAAFHGGPYGTLVAVEVVGHKVSVESILATMRMGKKFYFESGFTGIGQFPVRSFKSVTTQIRDINMVNAYVVLNTATAGGFKFKDDFAYIVLHDKGDDLQEKVIKAFGEKIQECLPFPIRPEWTPVIFEAAKKSGFVESLQIVGCFTAGFVLNLERDWQNLLSNLITTKQISVEGKV